MLAYPFSTLLSVSVNRASWASGFFADGCGPRLMAASICSLIQSAPDYRSLEIDEKP